MSGASRCGPRASPFSTTTRWWWASSRPPRSVGGGGPLGARKPTPTARRRVRGGRPGRRPAQLRQRDELRGERPPRAVPELGPPLLAEPGPWRLLVPRSRGRGGGRRRRRARGVTVGTSPRCRSWWRRPEAALTTWPAPPAPTGGVWCRPPASSTATFSPRWGLALLRDPDLLGVGCRVATGRVAHEHGGGGQRGPVLERGLAGP